MTVAMKLKDTCSLDGVIAHLEPNILGCKVKWASGTSLRTKLVKVMEFQLSCFKSWKMMLWKCCTPYASTFGKLSSGHRTWKVFISIPKKGSGKESSNYCTIALISYASKVMLKILLARLQQYMHHEHPDVQARFWKGRGTREQIDTICWIIERARDFKKMSSSTLLTMPKPLTMWITTKCGKFWKRWEYHTTWPASWEICMQVKRQQLDLDMEKQTGSK